jgi:tagatose-6-phosphate ketose/aldose isomerase
MIHGSARRVSDSVAEWLEQLKAGNGGFRKLLKEADSASGEGFRDTILEICQQPVTWSETGRYLASIRHILAGRMGSFRRIVLTGSGSSQYAGQCAAPALEKDLTRTVEAVGGGDLLLKGKASLAGEPTLVVSLARSGDSPESAAVVETLLGAERSTSHLVITCNPEGRLIKAFADDDRVCSIDLGPQVNDRSLVMTSSFTNLVLGARFLGWVERTGEFIGKLDRLDLAGRRILSAWPDVLGSCVGGEIGRIVFLGSGSRFGACREAALKLLEMTAGRVATMAETYLGLRHGPMCFVDDRTLVVCYRSSDPVIRNYERDLILELNAKGLGTRKVFAGTGDPGAGVCRKQDLVIPYELPEDTPDDDLTVLDAMIAQILGFHRSMKEGLRPDCPSVNGVISRVVGEFHIHRAAGDAE